MNDVVGLSDSAESLLLYVGDGFVDHRRVSLDE
jgi:hypothetical protein